MYRQPLSSSTSTASPLPANHTKYGSPLYPKIAQQRHAAGHPSLYQQTSTPSTSSGLSIEVAIKPEYTITPPGSLSDPIVTKYLASGLNREAVAMAVANYGDNPTKVREFVNGFTLLREMGFS